MKSFAVFMLMESCLGLHLMRFILFHEHIQKTKMYKLSRLPHHILVCSWGSHQHFENIGKLETAEQRKRMLIGKAFSIILTVDSISS
jgi:hypothetical protein